MFNLEEKEKKGKFNFEFPDAMQKNVNLKPFTSFKIGGTADIYITPSSLEELSAALELLKTERMPAMLLGGGTNLLIPDEGIRGAVIHTCRLKKIRTLKIDGALFVEAEAGVLMQEAIDFCVEQELAGLEDFAGLPGTVGGAVFMNARCYETSISDVLESASALEVTEKGCELKTYHCNQDEWDYKRSPFQPKDKSYTVIYDGRPIIVSALFKTEPGNRETICKTIAERIADRTAKGHFKLPSAGSVFKNNRAFGKPAGKLIEEAGLCGLRIGDAQVAPWHGNIIVNTDSATAREVTELIKTIQRRIKDQIGFELEPEIIFAE